MKTTITSRFFQEKEFKQITPSCSLQDMDQSTMDMFDKARELADIPFVLTCAYRSSRWDKLKGRSGTGSHTLGRAVDISCTDSSRRSVIINALMAVGFTRIGVAKTFIHADNSNKHSQRVIWTY